MISGQTLPSVGPDRVLPAQHDQHRQLRLALAALALPAFLVIGFALCYTSAIGTLVAGLAVFVLLNFPSSGASVQGPMLPTFWHVLNRFWIGASASDAFRGLVYFGGLGVGTDVLKLLGWLAVGVVLLALGWFKLRRGREEVTSAERTAA
jgi:hypothetical protein